MFDASQRHQETLADYDSFKSMSELQRTELLLKLRSAGSPLGGDKDPLLHLAWNDAAFHEAATGGPFADALGQPDARTVDSVEQVGLTLGCRRVAGCGLAAVRMMGRRSVACWAAAPSYGAIVTVSSGPASAGLPTPACTGIFWHVATWLDRMRA